MPIKDHHQRSSLNIPLPCFVCGSSQRFAKDVARDACDIDQRFVKGALRIPCLHISFKACNACSRPFQLITYLVSRSKIKLYLHHQPPCLFDMACV